MDHDLHNRIEDLEKVCDATLKSVRGLESSVRELRSEFNAFREEQREHNARIDHLLSGIGAALASGEAAPSAAVAGRDL